MLILIPLGSYLLGSLPVAWLITKLHHGQDLRALGSGNVGVMNTAISVHRWAGLIVFAAEMAKGALAVVIPRLLTPGDELLLYASALAVFIGTRWSIWLRGRGGRGNTAAATALALVSPLTLLILLVLNLAVRLLTGSSFTAMRVSLLALPLVFGLVMHSWLAVLCGAGFALLFMTTHEQETDDRLRIKARWQSVWKFLTMPRRTTKD